MKRSLMIGLVLLAAYMATGFYVVRGNEKAVLRRFGKVQKTETGNVTLIGSGLHYDLPWPCSQVDRVNINEIRTLSIGQPEEDDVAANQFLLEVEPAIQSQFLSGDKNILNLHVNVQYRISETAVDDFLYATEDPQARLQRLAESVLTDAVLRSGVDFVHTLGRNELREMLISRLQVLAEEQRLGLYVEDVTIGSVYPPIRVKAQFLDVMNARADKVTYINEASAYALKQLADAEALARKRVDEAEIYRQTIVEEARGAADSFRKVIARFRYDDEQGIQSYAAARQMALGRQYVETMQEILRNVAGKVFLDSGKPVDLTILRDPTE